jgi:hypothetical protein
VERQAQGNLGTVRANGAEVATRVGKHWLSRTGRRVELADDDWSSSRRAY